MFSRSLNDTSRVVKMMIVGDATTLENHSNDSRVVIYNRNVFIKEATGFFKILLRKFWLAKVSE